MPGITNPAEAFFKDGTWGWDGTQWRKLPLVWGYSKIWDENLGGAGPTGTYSATTSAIPADEVWVLQAVSLRNYTRAPASIQIYIARASGGVVFLGFDSAPALAVPLLVTGTFVLRTGDTVWVAATSCVVGDTMQGGVVGYKMAIAE